MNKVWLIIQREYLTRVKKRSFIVTTLLAPLGFALFFVSMVLIVGHGETKKRIAYIDQSGYDIKFRDTTSLYFIREDTSLAYLEMVYRNKNYDGVLFIPPIKNLSNPPGIQYFSDNQLGLNSVSHIEDQLIKNLKAVKVRQAHIDESVIADLNNTNVNIDTRIIGDQGETQVSSAISMSVGYIMGFLIYAVLFIYGQMVMKGVAEEKTSRIVEVIISSVKPFQLMLGKIFGIGAVALTQFVLWGILTAITALVLPIIFHSNLAEMQQMAANPATANGNMQEAMAKVLPLLAHYNWTAIFCYFIFYFFGGFLLYGALFAAVGAAANEQDDMQTLNLIVSIPIIISIYIMIHVVQDPNSAMGFWASIFPFTSPIVMTARIPFDPPLWQKLLSMLLLVAGFIFTTWIAGRVYRVGILMYGKKVSFKEVGKWLFYK